MSGMLRAELRLWWAAAWLCVAAVSVQADQFDEGASAYKDGRFETAAAIFEQLAERGDYRAMAILGSMYAGGQGISQNLEKAFHWLKQSAQYDQPSAQYRLGLMYDNGLGVVRNQKKAIRWFQKAAGHRYGPAQIMMGVKYARGEGFKQDKIKAYAWLSLANGLVAAGNSMAIPESGAVSAATAADAKAIFATLQAELSSADRQAAQLLARRYARGG
jgi:TPR repeat protein